MTNKETEQKQESKPATGAPDLLYSEMENRGNRKRKKPESDSDTDSDSESESESDLNSNTDLSSTGEPDVLLDDLMEVDPAVSVDDDMDVDYPIHQDEKQRLMNKLQTEHFCPIDERLIENILGSLVLQIVKSSEPAVTSYFASSDEFVGTLAWQVAFNMHGLLCGESWQTRMGPIRDQMEHLLCWDYVATDMVSAENVRIGYEDEFHPLSVLHLYAACRPDLIGTHTHKAPKNHVCYGYYVSEALQYMVDHGIPPREGNPEFDCNIRPTPSLSSRERIKGVTNIGSLELALAHLHYGPVAADLIVFSGLGKQSHEIYYGPLEPNTAFEIYHAVIIVAVMEYHGDVVAMCRMSNGEDIGDRGYVYVSLTTRYLVVNVVNAKVPEVRATPKPMCLLSNFVALEMYPKHYKKVHAVIKEAKEYRQSAHYGASSSSLPQESDREYFEKKRNLEDLWKAAFLGRTEDQHDALFEVNWNFKNIEEALEEGGKLHGKEVYVFGCTESQSIPHKNGSKTVNVPIVICIESTIPPYASVQGEVEEIIPMNDTKMAWYLYIPLDKRGRETYKIDFQVFILGDSQRWSASRLLKEDLVKTFNYCPPYIGNPFKKELSTVVQIIFPSEPPVVCEYDWVKDNLEELTNDLIKKGTLLMDQKDEFNVFVKEQSDKAKTAYEEVKQAREKAKKGMSEDMKLYKFYPLASPNTPDVDGINKSKFINRYLGDAHEVL